MKLLGIDYGRRRIGMAITDTNGDYIRGLNTIDCLKYGDYINAVCLVINAENPSVVVVGLPLDLNGGDTTMSYEVRAFAANIAERTRMPIVFVDESLSSVHAAQIMQFKRKKERRSKEGIDRIAACLILEHYKKEHAD